MKYSTYEELNSLLQEFVSEKNKLQKQIDENSLKIHEAECFAQELLGKEAEDFKLFSPRKIEDIYKNELEESSAKRADYEKQNSQLTEKRDKLVSIIDILQRVSDEIEPEHLDMSVKSDDGDLNSGFKEADKAENSNEIDGMKEISEVYENEQKIDSDANTLFDIAVMDRQRIARDLQAFVLEDLELVFHKVELCNKFFRQDSVRARQEIEAASGSLSNILEKLDEIISNLQPLSHDNMNLKDMFEELLSSLNGENIYQIETEFENVSCENYFVYVLLYQIVYECLDNIYRHSDAKKIIFSCEMVADKCVIFVEDDGRGFILEEEIEEQKNHFGLLFIKKCISLLNGDLNIDSKIGEGTKIKIEVKL